MNIFELIGALACILIFVAITLAIKVWWETRKARKYYMAHRRFRT